MDAATRKKMGEQSIALAKECGYTTTGTVEFLMDKHKDFYFLEMNTRLQVEHPITEQITGVDLVEQQIKIAAGYKLDFTQNDVKIKGHSVEYRVYAEDPARKFLPSIGFLRKYREPSHTPNVRVDTGIEEGSEISMYYDPMISKLITTGKDRADALALMDSALKEYVVRGVGHNLGFGISIVNNEHFYKGDYNTAFIPNYYPEGFNGEVLTTDDNILCALMAAKLRNKAKDYAKIEGVSRHSPHLHDVYVTVNERDYRVQLNEGETHATITEVDSGKQFVREVTDFEFESQTILRSTTVDPETKKSYNEVVQFVDSKFDMEFNLWHRGTNVHTIVYNPTQYECKPHMPEVVKIDTTKVVMSPMPGTIVSVNVKPGDTVEDGQELLVIEAMKMQNQLKSERSGKVKSVSVKSGDAVPVDHVLIEFE